MTCMLLPRSIGCGINLHTLPLLEISRCGCSCRGNIDELRSLNKIRELCICGLGNVACIEDAKGAQLQSKKHLQTLRFRFDSRMHNCEYKLQGEPVVTLSHKELLGSLQPHHVLTRLEVSCYESQRYPSWLGNASFSNLTEICLVSCKSQHLPTLANSLWDFDRYQKCQLVR